MTDQDGYERDVRDWLEGVDVPPPRLDAGQLLHTGRAQLRRRRQLALGGMAVAALAVAVAVPAAVQLWPAGTGGLAAAVGESTVPPETTPPPPLELDTLDCAVTELPMPDGAPDISVEAMDPTGRYVVGNHLSGDYQPVVGWGLRYVEGDEPTLAIRWEDGSPAVIPALRGAAVAKDVNAHGVVIGEGWDQNDRYAWIYRAGKVTELPVPAGHRNVDPVAINESGDVIGNLTDPAGRRAVVRWPAAEPEAPQLLEAPGGADASASTLTDGGDVLGWVMEHQEARMSRPYRWDASGEGHELPLPAHARGAGVSAARGGWALGNASMPASEPAAVSPAPSVSVPVRWDLRAGTVEVIDPPEDLANVSPVAINPAGEVELWWVQDVSVHHDHELNVAYSTSRAVVVRDGEAFFLPVRPTAEPTMVWTSAVGTSDDGAVIAGIIEYGEPDNGVPAGEPVVWNC